MSAKLRKCDYLYVKIYEENKFQSLYLSNPDILNRYNKQMSNLLMKTNGKAEEHREAKIKVYSQFAEIFEYDCNFAILPTPNSPFETDEERENFRKKKILNQNFINSLGPIFISYHNELARIKRIPLPELSNYTIDFNEVLNTAMSDYFGKLIGIKKQVRIVTTQTSNEPAKAVQMQTVTGAGESKTLYIAEKNKKIYRPPNAIAATYIFPTLLEQILLSAFENKLILKWIFAIAQKLKNQEISLIQNEENIYNAIIGASGSGKLFPDKKRNILWSVWDIGKKYGVWSEDDDRCILLGKNDKGDDYTLGSLIKSKAASRYLRPEYVNILEFLFGRKYLNLRNLIAHGDQSDFDYLHLGYVAVMYQIFIDIVNGDAML